MESDLPLIEIAGEDDSLLEQLPDLDDTHIIPNVSSSYFACSPLQLSMIKPRLSCSKGFKARMDPAKPNCSSTQSSSNKENINVNKSEVPKLSVEPLQMKKRKKGGGYNLRKSLAWDRAFDTDEGVLDPFELSMIAGAFSKSRRENLPIISEEGSDTLYAGSNCTNESEDLQAVDGTLFTELSDMSNTLKEDEEKGACLVPRHISSTQDNINSTPKATRKVLSTYGGAKSGSKGGGCPKPLTSSSLKRPACASTVRVIRKDSKLPKLPASTTGSCLLPTHANTTTQYSSYLKPNQIAKPAVNIQKTVTTKCSSTNVKCAQTKAKTGPGVVASRVNDSARNLTNSLLEAQSSTNSRLLHISGVNSGSEVIPQSKVPSTRFHLREGQFSSGSPTISLSLNPSIANGKVINPKIQSMKPSGLRKPSPSMRFFGQSKASGSETLMQRSVGLCDSYLRSNIDGTHKFGLSRPPPVPGKTPLTASISNKQWSSSSALCAVPDKTVKSDLGVLNVQNRETEVQSDCKSSESLCWKQNGNGNGNIEAKPEVCLPMDCIQLKETVLKHHSNDFRVRGSNVLSVIDTKVPANHEHGSHKNFMLNVSFVGEAMPSDFGTYLSTESGLLVQATQPSSEGSNVPLKVVDQLSHNVVKESQMHEDPYNRQRIEASVGSSFQRSTAAEDSQFYLADAGDDQGCSYIMEISHRQIQTADQADKDVGKVDNVPESHLAAQIQLFNGDKLVGSCSNDTPISHEQSTKIAIPVEVLGEQPEFPDRNLKVQQVLVDNQENLLLDSEGFCKDSLLENVEDVPEDIYGCDLGTMVVITQATTAELENCHDFADDQPSLDVVPLGSPVIDSTECNEFSVDSPIIRSMESSGQAISCIDSSLKEANDHSTSLSATFTEPSSIHEISSLTGPVQKIFGEQPEVSNPYYEIEEVRTKHNQVTLKDDISPKKIIDSEKFQLDYVAESLADVPEGSFIYDNDPSSSNEVVQAPLTAERIELSENGQSYVVDGPSLPLKSSVENHEYFTAGKISHDIEISGQASSGIEPDLNISKDQTLSLETTSEFCSLHEESCSFVGEDTNLSKSSSQLSIGVNDLKNYQDETVTTDGNCLAGELHHELDTAGDLEKDMDATLSIKSSENKMKLDVPLIKPPPNAVPFSDEWLAAIEAAGEDILTLKSGAVQNSPTDKSLPEPSPWSPVKRKNIQLGPFDCTKKLGNTLPGEPSN